MLVFVAASGIHPRVKSVIDTNRKLRNRNFPYRLFDDFNAVWPLFSSSNWASCLLIWAAQQRCKLHSLIQTGREIWDRKRWLVFCWQCQYVVMTCDNESVLYVRQGVWTCLSPAENTLARSPAFRGISPDYTDEVLARLYRHPKLI